MVTLGEILFRMTIGKFELTQGYTCHFRIHFLCPLGKKNPFLFRIIKLIVRVLALQVKTFCFSSTGEEISTAIGQF